MARPPRRLVEELSRGPWRQEGGAARICSPYCSGRMVPATTASLPAMARVAGESLPKGAAPSEGKPVSAGAASRDGSSRAVIVLAAPAAGSLASWRLVSSRLACWQLGPSGVMLAKVRLATPAGFPCSATLPGLPQKVRNEIVQIVMSERSGQGIGANRGEQNGGAQNERTLIRDEKAPAPAK